MKTVFLDRDGVLNVDPIGDYITKPDDFKLLPGVRNGLKRLDWEGYRLIAISNQAGIGDGVFTRKDLDKVNARMVRILADAGLRLSGIYYCLHGKNEGCGCRKPQIGLFLQAATDFRINRSTSFLIGDKISDVEAGHAFGIKVIMVRTGHGTLEEKKLRAERPEYLVSTFTDAVEIILKPTP